MIGEIHYFYNGQSNGKKYASQKIKKLMWDLVSKEPINRWNCVLLAL